MRSKEERKIRLHSSMLTDEGREGAWEVFAKTVQRLHLLYFCIDQPVVPPSKLIEISEQDAVDLVLKTFKRNHDVVKLLNS